ncbi:hypothetical protein H8E88_19985 [candidate division KSB1 bacterium]|nr:hypothetical protein [candidate division KSB1 bacterium]
MTACGGKSGIPKGVEKVYFPDWWRIQDSPDYVFTYGMGEKVSQNSSFDAAKANAMLEAAQYVESYVKGMVKNYEEEAGIENPQVLALTTKVVKDIAKAKFTNTLVNQQQTIMVDTPNGQRYKTFVRVSIPKDSVNKNMLDKIKNEEALYNQFKASQAFDELDKEMENYNE